MATGSAVTREEHRTLSAAGNVENVEMVEQPKRINDFALVSGTVGLNIANPPVVSTLLPVHPPEVNAVILVLVMEDVEVFFHKVRRKNVEGNDIG